MEFDYGAFTLAARLPMRRLPVATPSRYREVQVTESEAKQKWCPYTQIALGPSDEFGRANCVGSKCAMWREIKYPQDHPTFKVTFTGEEIITQQVDIIDYGGFCGLAGKP